MTEVTIFVELDRAADRGAVTRNRDTAQRALAHGDVLTLAFEVEAPGIVVVTAWVQER